MRARTHKSGLTSALLRTQSSYCRAAKRRDVPMADSCAAAPQQSSVLFNHLVGAREQRRRDPDAERFGGLVVDDHLEPRRLPEWQFARLGATQDFRDLLGSVRIN